MRNEQERVSSLTRLTRAGWSLKDAHCILGLTTVEDIESATVAGTVVEVCRLDDDETTTVERGRVVVLGRSLESGGLEADYYVRDRQIIVLPASAAPRTAAPTMLLRALRAHRADFRRPGARRVDMTITRDAEDGFPWVDYLGLMEATLEREDGEALLVRFNAEGEVRQVQAYQWDAEAVASAIRVGLSRADDLCRPTAAERYDRVRVGLGFDGSEERAAECRASLEAEDAADAAEGRAIVAGLVAEYGDYAVRILLEEDAVECGDPYPHLPGDVLDDDEITPASRTAAPTGISDGDGDASTGLDAAIEAIETAQSSWTGWDWAQSFSGGLSADELAEVDSSAQGAMCGSGAIVYDGCPNAAELEGLPSSLAEEIREYDEAATAAARQASDLGAEAIEALRDGDLETAVGLLESACDAEREYGDDPVWSVPREMAQALLDAEAGTSDDDPDETPRIESGRFLSDPSDPYELTRDASGPGSEEMGRVMLTLDLRHGGLVSADGRKNSQTGTPADEYYGTTDTWELPFDVDSAVLRTTLLDTKSALHRALQALYDLYEGIGCDDNANPRPEWLEGSEEAREALDDTITRLCEDIETHAGMAHVDAWWTAGMGTAEILETLHLTLSSSEEEIGAAAIEALEDDEVGYYEGSAEAARWLADLLDEHREDLREAARDAIDDEEWDAPVLRDPAAVALLDEEETSKLAKVRKIKAPGGVPMADGCPAAKQLTDDAHRASLTELL